MTFSRFMFYCSLLVAGAYCALTFYPDSLFDNNYSAGNVSVHSRLPLNEASKAIIGRVREKIAADDFFDPAQRFELYFTGDGPLYALLTPVCGVSFSCFNPVSEKIFIAAPDFEKNQAYSTGGVESPRVLESVITHEVVKSQLKHRLGGPNYLFMAEMKKDGYAEHITMETAELQPAEICAEDKKFVTVRHFLELRLVLEQVMFETDSTYPSLMNNNKGDEAAFKRLRQKHCK